MEILYQGTLLNQATHSYEDVQVQTLNDQHRSQILQVQQHVVEHLQVKESLQSLTLEEFEHVFNEGGLMIGAFVGEQLIAFRALLFPGDDPENLGRDLGLSVAKQQKVVHQELTCVLPDYRGNGLQNQLAQLIMKKFSKLQLPYRYLCCTVFPTNVPSVKDKFKQAMLIAKIKEKYSGKMRYIFFKDLEQSALLDRKTIKAVPIADYEQQKVLLQEGFYGFDTEEENGETTILFAKPSTGEEV
ncbi:GNAT family N-acetyltransferase [Halalkalibacter alkalisediminis]|uniref:GNAT family N-acetyltransferase n=1 Tax=Halalkalibacter alkalisediminis TaxID=935616 RepID=A0ABV6NMH7_9BACI|nr:GNAT family N-acetyltransferase [Halalkalibacter alkalisediminis]